MLKEAVRLFKRTAFHPLVREDWLAIVAAYNSVLSIGNSKFGWIALAVTFVHPNIAASGLIAVASALMLFKVMGSRQDSIIRGMLLYNSLLVGLFIGYLFQIDFSVAVLIILSSCLTLFLTFFLDSIFKVHQVPVLSIPFVMVAGCIALSLKNFTNLTDATPYFNPHVANELTQVPAVILAFFKAVGTVYCIPDPLVGLILFTGLIFHSPMTGLFLVCGFTAGYVSEASLALGHIDVLQKQHYFNYMLTFNALAGVFLVPSRISILLGFLGSVLATLIATSALSFWSIYHIPILSFPYNCIVLLIVQTIKTVSPGKMNSLFPGTPERTLDLTQLYQQRFKAHEIGIFCPFEDTWNVQQSFDGEWTHQGHWRHALDFVKVGESGKTFQRMGIEVEDYYAFNQPVCSPVEGYVVDCRFTFPDNRIGQVDNQNNWGNYVLIRSLGGVYVLLAHLKANSGEVKVGDYLILGQRIAKCGNSGYSQEPHLHLQVQLSSQIGYYTTAFHLLNYRVNESLYFYGVPEKGESVTPIQLNKALEQKLTFRIGEVQTFELNDGHQKKRIELVHQLDSTLGRYYWTDGESRVYYGREGASFYFYGLSGQRSSPLWDLYASAPRIPMTYGSNVSFDEPLPLQVSYSKIKEWVVLMRGFLTQSPIHNKGRYEMNTLSLTLSGKAHIHGKLEKTYLKIDPISGVLEFQVGQRSYVRVA
jgi:urea transporter